VKGGVSTIGFGNLAPQLPSILTAAITHVKRNDLARVDIHGQPNPLFVCLVLHKARHCVGFHFETLDHDISMVRDWLHMQMVWQSFKTGDDKSQ
jgi:hypothetical protein